MSMKKGVSKCKLVAKLVTEEEGPCAFCQRDVDDELIYGKLYAIGSIKCHYFCVLLSCCMVQNGRDKDGLFGFLYPDILAEIKRSKKHKCSYCNKEGATLGCCVAQCRKQFHLPCGREKDAVSLFYGSYKSFCQSHTPKQKIADDVLVKAKVRMQAERKRLALVKAGVAVEDPSADSDSECVCVICYERVRGFATPQTFWPPCCARDAWFHRACMQRMALSAGMHYLKCPLCNDRDQFYDALVSQGYYVPDRDAAWELEQNAFADIYERPLRCTVEDCCCPEGREYDSESGMWELQLCLACGGGGAHARCLRRARRLCALCRGVADLDVLADALEAEIVKEQERASVAERRPIMPPRMSLRRTKPANNCASTSKATILMTKSESATSREDLNLKTPKRQQTNVTTLNDIQNRILSPTKILEHPIQDKSQSKLSGHEKDIQNMLLSPSKVIQQLYEKISAYNVDSSLVDRVKEVFRKPKPMSVKRKIVDNLLDNIVNNFVKENARSMPAIEWPSPKKCLADTPVALEDNIIRRSKGIMNSPYKSPVHTPKKPTKCETHSPFKSPKVTPKKMENHDFENRTPRKTDYCSDTPNNDDNFEVNPEIASDDESSSSTFRLPPEFIADDSNDYLPIFETPKLKTVDIQKDSSLEISENDEVVKVKVMKMEDMCENNDFIKNLDIKSPVTSKKCALKYSPINKETLEKDKGGFDAECFKNRYLSEVCRDFKCNFRHNHNETPEKRSTIKTAIDFAVEASNERKRSRENCENVPKKKRKMSSNDKVRMKKNNKKHIKTSTDIEVTNAQDNLKLSVQGKRKKKKTKVSIKDKEIKVKIQWKKERLQVKITESKHKQASPKLKQYVLKYADAMLENPKYDVSPMKRKYVKQEKSPDNLKQTSIQSFFKVKLPKQE
nr:uncharacterized protein LOC128682083 isoform X2 [Plodia interpunctella]